MGFTEETVRFKLDDSNKKEISETLTDVYASLNDKGYNPIEPNRRLRIEWRPCLRSSL